jgi:hypothetical protein
MAQNSKGTNLSSDEDMYLAIDAAIQSHVKRGLVVDSGRRKWSERTGRYEVVWVRTDDSGTVH